MKTFKLDGSTAVVTGAACGIGAAVARALADHGCRLALIDRRHDDLAEIVEQCRHCGVDVSGHLCDLGDPKAIAQAMTDILAYHPRPNILINNAGVALVGRFDEVTQAEMEAVFAVNFWGAVSLTRALLPTMGEAQQAQIVNVGSIYGLIAPPGHLTYSASKFALRGFSESLGHELRGTSIGVTLICPGHVRTKMAIRAQHGQGVGMEEAYDRVRRFERMMHINVDFAAQSIVDGIRRRAKRVLIGQDARIVALITRLLPVSYWPIIEWRSNHIMNRE